MTPEGLRTRFHAELQLLQDQLVALEVAGRQLLDRSLSAMATGRTDEAEAVEIGDDEIDRHCLQLQQGVAGLIARQQPVATDLRLLIALDHAALHLERIGDEAVNIARAVASAPSFTPSVDLLGRLRDMGATVQRMSKLAVEAFITRDRAGCDRVAALDAEVDELDRALGEEFVRVAREDGALEWAMRMNRVSRHLERAADHAVDVAEQAWYVITGELRELD
jgi:phosphate transport system protein